MPPFGGIMGIRTEFMISLIAGLLLLIAPFLLLIFFDDKKRGFIFILFWVVAFHTALAFFTQLFGIFGYWLIFFLNTFVAILTIVIFLKYKKKINPGKHYQILHTDAMTLVWSIGKKIDWMVLVVVVIFSLNLYQVHYNYTGEISLATDSGVVYHQVENFKYPYPYYSDEWYSVALIKNSIETKSLPIENPFFKGSYFANFELFFHSFLSEIILLLKINPLTGYTKIAIFANTLMGLLVYLFLRIGKIRKLPSGIASLFLLYIVSASNLPGIWNLIPLTMGVLSFLIGFCFMALGEKKMALATSLLIFLFYPPLLVFYLPAALIYIYARA